jgi:hypothetical protein
MELKERIKNNDHVFCLLGLGSMADTQRLDEFSDIDFFLIVEKGKKQAFLKNLSWLEIRPIAFKFKNTPDGYKVMFDDGVFAEFAVFEPDELKSIPFTEGNPVYMKPGFDEDILKPRHVPKKKTLDVSFNINEALTNLLIGLQREIRGEHASAFTFIQVNAAKLIMELFETVYEPNTIKTDPFDNDRRIEKRFKKAKTVLSNLKQGYSRNKSSAAYALEFLDKHFSLNEAMKDKIKALANT